MFLLRQVSPACVYAATPTFIHPAKCLHVFFIAVYFIQTISSVAVGGGAVAHCVGLLLLEVPSSAVRVVGQVGTAPTLALRVAHPEGGVFGLTKLDPLPT